MPSLFGNLPNLTVAFIDHVLDGKIRVLPVISPSFATWVTTLTYHYKQMVYFSDFLFFFNFVHIVGVVVSAISTRVDTRLACTQSVIQKCSCSSSLPG